MSLMNAADDIMEEKIPLLAYLFCIVANPWNLTL